MISLPAEFAARADRGGDWGHWLKALPRLMAEIAVEWKLEPYGHPMTGETAIVVPVVTAAGSGPW